MKIWFINHYAVPPIYYPLSRPSKMAKELIKMGHDVTIIAASTVHNSHCYNLIEGTEKVKKIVDDGVPYVLINCTPYRGNGIKRVINILEFARKLPKVLDSLGQPDVIMATSFDPFTCYEGIKYAKGKGIKAIAEIADLWPETLVAYTSIKENNPIVKILRAIEKKIYLMANEIVFTMEGAYDYILEQHWEQLIPRNKVHYINNGVDLNEFDYNKRHYTIEDSDLMRTDVFNVVYTGSIRRVNNLDLLLDVARLITKDNIKFLIWGGGEELGRLQDRLRTEEINNVIFKGRVDKKYIPYITSNADLNFAHNESSPLFRFGISLNKLFDYMAAGKPILIDFKSKYNPANSSGCYISVDDLSKEKIAETIIDVSNMKTEDYENYCKNARAASMEYDFSILAQKLMDVINAI